jgi:hypothetical protein
MKIGKIMHRDVQIMGLEESLQNAATVGDLASQGSLPNTARALHGISQPGGQHN